MATFVSRLNSVLLAGTAAALLPLWAALAVAEEATPAAGSADVIYVQGGKKRTGEIVEEYATKIVYRAEDGKPQTVRREEIVRVEYSNRPSDLLEAERAASRGDFEAAASWYRAAVKACEGGKARAIFKPHALLGLGRALVGAGRFVDAARAFEEAIAAAPRGLFVREATCEAVRAYLRAGEAKKGLELAEKAKERYREAASDLPDEAQDEASLLRAEALEAGGRAEEARSAYNLLTNSKDGRVRGRALLGVARGALAAKEFERAEAKFREILQEKEVDRFVRCGAARGLGDALLSRPNARKDTKALRAASEAYAKALAVHFPGRAEVTEDREAALAALADCYDALAAQAAGEEGAKARELYSSGARQLREEFVRLYRSSPLYPAVEAKLKAAEGVTK